jgi:hypothetical protein
MGKWDSLKGCVSWLVEPFYGNHIHRLVRSTHHLGAEVLAKTHRLSLAAFGEKMSLKSNQMTHPSLAPLKQVAIFSRASRCISGRTCAEMLRGALLKHSDIH